MTENPIHQYQQPRSSGITSHKPGITSHLLKKTLLETYKGHATIDNNPSARLISTKVKGQSIKRKGIYYTSIHLLQQNLLLELIMGLPFKMNRSNGDYYYYYMIINIDIKCSKTRTMIPQNKQQLKRSYGTNQVKHNKKKIKNSLIISVSSLMQLLQARDIQLNN